MKTRGAWVAVFVAWCGCGGAAAMPAASPSESSSGASTGSGGGAAPGASAGDDPATTQGDERGSSGSKKEREQRADDCLAKCYQSPAAVSGDALRDMCETRCHSKGSGTVQPAAK
jgi:hypothetical protein